MCFWPANQSQKQLTRYPTQTRSFALSNRKHHVSLVKKISIFCFSIILGLYMVIWLVREMRVECALKYGNKFFSLPQASSSANIYFLIPTKLLACCSKVEEPLCIMYQHRMSASGPRCHILTLHWQKNRIARQWRKIDYLIWVCMLHGLWPTNRAPPEKYYHTAGLFICRRRSRAFHPGPIHSINCCFLYHV